jgi:hypothetical protein
MKALALVAFLALAGCMRDHPPGVVQTGDNGCLTCHLHDYQATTMPVHAGEFPRTCGDCHRTVGWQPALEGLHAGRFPRGGAHADVACLDCHDPDRGPSAGGANTICALCHTHRRSEADGQHDDVAGYAWLPDDPSFCLRCHPTGGGD